MSRKWKPGDVAMVTWSNATGAQRARGIRRRETRIALRGEGWWGFPGDPVRLTDDKVSDPEIDVEIRPLVVIDPEDREQVALILSHYHSWKWTADIAEASITDMQAALREFANPKPPKPDEPTGLGAVVLLANGHKAIRTGEDDVQPWLTPTPPDAFRRLDRYADLPVVRVLSEGVR